MRRFCASSIKRCHVKDQDVDIKTFWEAKPETASRARADIERLLSWSTVKGLRSGDNPARWRGFLETQLPGRGIKFAPVRHLAALPHSDLPDFMAELRKHEGSGASALEFAILTAARSGAVIGATWPEIDLVQKVWTVAGGREGAKTDITRRVPLCQQALALLADLPRELDNPHLFIGAVSGRGISNMTMSKALKAINPNVTVHGMRSCFADWVTECTDYPPHIREASLWHSSGDATERAYVRGDALQKRRELMNAWADYCDGKSNVIELHPKVGA